MRFLTLLFVVITGSLTAQSSYNGDNWKDVKEKGKGIISVAYVETPSFVYQDNNGKLTGICVDIMNDFIIWANQNKKVNIQTTFVGDGSSFKGMYEKVKQSKGGVFGVGNLTITEERKKEVKFTQPFITNVAILITQNSIPTLSKMDDMPKTFASMTAYTAKGTLNEKRITDLKAKYYPDLKISYTTTSPEALEKVFTDPKGFAYLDMAFYLEAVKLKKNIKRHPVGDQAVEQFGIIMPLNSDWTPLFDEFLKADGGYYSSAKYKNILVKHLGEAGVNLIKAAGKKKP